MRISWRCSLAPVQSRSTSHARHDRRRAHVLRRLHRGRPQAQAAHAGSGGDAAGGRERGRRDPVAALRRARLRLPRRSPCIRPHHRLLGGVTSIHRGDHAPHQAPRAACRPHARAHAGRRPRRRLGRANGPAHRGDRHPFPHRLRHGRAQIIDAFLPVGPVAAGLVFLIPGAAVVWLGLKATGVAQQWEACSWAPRS